MSDSKQNNETQPKKKKGFFSRLLTFTGKFFSIMLLLPAFGSLFFLEGTESYVVFLIFGVPGGIMFYKSFGMASKVQKFSDDMEKTMLENEKKRKVEEAKKKQMEKDKKKAVEESIEIAASSDLKKLDDLRKKVEIMKKMKLYDVNDFKKIVQSQEKSIIEKGGDDKFFEFLKINTFLQDFKEKLDRSRDEMDKAFPYEDFKFKIKYHHRAMKTDKIYQAEELNNKFKDNLAALEGKKGPKASAALGWKEIFKIGDSLVPTFDAENRTLEYYHNIALASLTFYLNDKKTLYFEIKEGFERLGVFDSTWQKNVANKLDRIEIRLANLSNQLTDLNSTFENLVENSNQIVKELKSIDESIMTNNALTAINTYMTWRVNTKLKK